MNCFGTVLALLAVNKNFFEPCGNNLFVETKANILEFLASSSQPDAISKPRKGKQKGDSFQTILAATTIQSSSTVAQTQNRPEPKEAEKTPASTKTSESTRTTQEQHESSETVSHKDTEPQETSYSNQEEEVRDHLKTLDDNEENVEDIEEVLSAEAKAGYYALLNALTKGDTNAIQSEADIQSVADLENFLSQLKDKEALVLNFLKQSGLSETEAKNLLKNLQAKLETKLPNGESLFKNINANLNNSATVASDSVEISSDDLLSKQNLSQNQSQSQSKSDFFSQFKLNSDISNSLDSSPDSLGFGNSLNKTGFQFFTSADSLNISNSLSNSPSTHSLLEGLNNGTAPTIKVADNLAQGTGSVKDVSIKALDGVKAVTNETIASRTVNEKAIINRIVDRVSFKGNGLKNEVFIKLDPPSLGSVRMNISTVGDSVRATVVTETQAVKQVIENNLSALRDSIGDQGLKVESFTVLVGGNPGQKGFGSQSQADRSFSGLPATDNAYAPEAIEDTVPYARSAWFDESQSISVFA